MGSEIGVAQFIAYVALTASSLTVAIVSVTLAYRQNFGWKPLVFVTSHGLQTQPIPSNVYFATLDFEFWNRRKYPLVLRHMEVRFSTIKVKELKNDEVISRDWYVHAGKSMSLRGDQVLDPTAHKKLSIAAPFDTSSLDDLEDKLTIQAMYYDPRKNRTSTITVEHLWHLKSAPPKKGGLVGMFKKIAAR